MSAAAKTRKRIRSFTRATARVAFNAGAVALLSLPWAIFVLMEDLIC